MDDYLSKPLRGDDLLAAIARLASPRTVTAPPEAAAVAPVVATVVAPAAAVLDEAALLETVANDRTLLAELVVLFEEDATKYMAHMRAAIANGDGHALQVAAHSVKGAAGSLTATAVAHAAGKLERNGRSGGVEGAETILRTMEREVARVRERLLALTGDA
jgi:HPt (histidine-containing phosphotransfer) domain-containing protein